MDQEMNQSFANYGSNGGILGGRHTHKDACQHKRGGIQYTTKHREQKRLWQLGRTQYTRQATKEQAEPKATSSETREQQGQDNRNETRNVAMS